MTPVPRTPGRSTGKRKRYYYRDYIPNKQARRSLDFESTGQEMRKRSRGGFSQSDGFSSGRMIKTRGGYKKFRISKIINSNVTPYTLSLGWKQVRGQGQTVARKLKHMVSEMNPGVAGLVPIAFNTGNADFACRLTNLTPPSAQGAARSQNQLLTDTNQQGQSQIGAFHVYPMHVYDLNAIPFVNKSVRDSAVGDSFLSYNSAGNLVAANMCLDVNSRAWTFGLVKSSSVDDPYSSTVANLNTAGPLKFSYGWLPIRSAFTSEALPGTAGEWYVDEPRYDIIDMDTRNASAVSSGLKVNPLTRNNKVYKKGVYVDFQGYSCGKMPTSFDVRVIRITDKRYCPDYVDTLDDNQLQQVRNDWYGLIHPYVCNPMLSKEGKPKRSKRWFKTVAKARIDLPEQTGDVETYPSQRASLYAKVNELLNFATDFNGQNINLQLDQPPERQDDVSNPNDKPWYTSRLYLVIRAVSRLDTRWSAASGTTGSNMNQDGGNLLTGAWTWRRSGYLVNNTGDKTAPDPGGLIAPNYTPSYDLMIKCTYLCDNSADFDNHY